MISTSQIVILIICLFFMVYICSLVIHHKLMLQHSLIWFCMGLVVCICALFPAPLFALSSLLGFELSSNFIFILAIFFLLAFCLSLSILISKQSNQIKTLVQHQALLEKRLEKIDGLHTDKPE